MLGKAALKTLAAKRGITPAQLALAWLLRQDGVVVIPKAGQVRHIDENAAALKIALAAEDLAALDREFPPPKAKRPLELL